MENYTNGLLIIATIDNSSDIEEMELQFPLEKIDKSSEAVYDDITVPNSEFPVSYWVSVNEKLSINTVFTGEADEIKETAEWFNKLTRDRRVALILGELFEGMEWIVRSVNTSYEIPLQSNGLRPTLLRVSLSLSLVVREV